MGSLFPEDDFGLFGIVLGMPLLGAIVNGIWGKRLGKEAVRFMAIAAVTVSFLASVLTFIALDQAVDASTHLENGVSVHEHVRLSWNLWEWMHTNGGRGGSGVPIALKFSVDALSSVMMLIITGIGALIHLYASAYMDKDKGYWRFFAYLNLFIFSMLVLVMADNLPVLFIGWEGVGLCSYLLIGFWYEKMPNAQAGKKAFIANRIGDFGLICAMFMLAHYTGALDWAGIENGATSLVDPPTDAMRVHIWPIGGGRYEGIFSLLQPTHPLTISAATAVGLALVLGCTGKSAQIPLYVWLPDAMAGPTPVSALIHAATMVTAGIYLICRLNFVFVLSPFVMMVVAIIGAATAVLAATIALVQNDIKKVLAYSTVSQLGFMFLGVGVGAFTAGFFHVLTHAFFKGCLFLGAGSVIYQMHKRIHDDDKAQDMRHMGGMRKYMPYTFWTFLVATLAIIGTPFMSGFFSKDEILFRTYVNHLQHPMLEKLKKLGNTPYEPPAALGPVLYWVGIIAATMTAFYMCRALYLTFFGDFRGWTIGRASTLPKAPKDDHGEHHEDDLTKPGHAPHESPWQMTVPLIVLATGAAVAGIFINMGPFHFTPLEHWLAPVFEGSVSSTVHPLGGEAAAEHMVWPLAMGGVAAWAVGSGIAYWMYIQQKGAPAKSLAEAMPRLHKWAMDKWYVDEFYEWSVLSAVDALAETSASFDKSVVDMVLAKISAFVVSAAGTVLRAFQNGVVHVYAGIMVVGVALIGWFYVAPHAAATYVQKDTDWVVSTSPSGGLLGYSYEWAACEPDKKQWQDAYDVVTKEADAKKRAGGQADLVKQLEGQHAKCEAPGDKWITVGKEGFTDQADAKIHLDADADTVIETNRPVRLRAKNVFSKYLGDIAASTTVLIPREAKKMTLEVGVNQ
ncbi:MAG TPA: NADH-quinone oxidoreductase subunit L [Polyangiaceae bacterium]